MKVENMAPNARKAYEELIEKGIPVKDWGVDDGYDSEVQFILPWADDEVREIYADFDNSQKYREYLEDEGSRYVGRIREDIHLICIFRWV